MKPSSRWLAMLSLWAANVLPAYAAAPLAPIRFVCVDDQAIGYATFQSHNQKVVANEHGIFLTHLRRRNDAYTRQTWRLSRSQNGGESFTTLFEDTHATNPPVLETDGQGNIYLVRVDFANGDGFLYRFLAQDGFQQPLISKIPRAAAGKYAMTIDLPRACLYFFAHNNTFHVVNLDGTIAQSMDLLRPGTHAVLQYPLLSLDDAGNLHAAWTTQKRGEYLYWDIHHMLSPDGGQTWQNLDGARLTPPVVADDGGAALRISGEDEFTAHTWLSSVLANKGKCHFLYLAQTEPPRQHYLRYDLTTARRDRHIQPRYHGDQMELRGLDGFFATDHRNDEIVYCIGHDQGHLACLISRDRGATWQDHARSEQAFHLYSVGGFRHTTADGWILGSFTDQSGSNVTTDHSSKVYFFAIRGDSLDAAPRHRKAPGSAWGSRRQSP